MYLWTQVPLNIESHSDSRYRLLIWTGFAMA